MNNINRWPIEVFCYHYVDKSESAILARKQQYCRYVKGTCVKPRKSEPHIKVGICTLGSSVNRGKQIYPVIVCPQRFKEEAMFETIRNKYLSHWKNVKWVQEVNIGVGGSIDYVAVEVDKYDRVQDFLCVELQAAGTTGSPYPYVKELLGNGHYSGKKYTYNINWANEFCKTMMQQAYKKGKILNHWHRKIVFVLQNIAMDYIQSASDCSLLEDYNPELPVDFCSFALQEQNNYGLTMVFDNIKSTTIDGINKILGGAPPSAYPTEEEFIRNIIKKGLADGVLSSNPNLMKLLS